MKRGIDAGSFDPPTRGHLDVMRRASLIVDELHVMIGVNPKKSGGFFPVAKRLELIEGSLAHMEWFGRDRSAFHIGQFAGLLVDYCRHTHQGARQLPVAGCRQVRDYFRALRAPCWTRTRTARAGDSSGLLALTAAWWPQHRGR